MRLGIDSDLQTSLLYLAAACQGPLFLTLLEGYAQADARNDSRNEGQEECVIRRATCHERQHRTYAVQSNSGFSKVCTWKHNGEEPLRQVRHEAQHVVGEKVRHGRYISTHHQCCHLFQLLRKIDRIRSIYKKN